MKKSLFLTFCFSFIPGAGQMYQGYMKKGMSLMALLGLSIAIASLTNINIFIIPIPLIFAYAFFDTYNLRNKIGTQNEEKDRIIWENEEIEKLLDSFRTTKKNNFIGICLILIGTYILLNSVFMNIAIQYDLQIFIDAFRIIRRYLAPTIIAAISIALGIKFIQNSK